MKRMMISVLTLFLLMGCTSIQDDTTPQVLTSIYPLYDLTKIIASDDIIVHNIAPISMEVHDYEPSPKDLVMLEKAELLIVHGAGLEGWLERTLNNVQNKDLKVLIVSDSIELLDGDPHTWLSMDAMIQYGELIETELSFVFPEYKALQEANYTKWKNEAEGLKNDYLKYFQDGPKDIIVDHLAYAYLANEFNLNQISITKGQLSSEVSAKQLKEIIDTIRQDKPTVIYKDEMSSESLYHVLEDEANVSIETLYTLEQMNPKEYHSYLEMMEKNYAALAKGVSYD